MTLERYEVHFANEVAKIRTRENKQNHIYNRDDLEPQPLAELNACCGEMAVAKSLNKYWSGLAWLSEEHQKYKETIPDIGENIEVRRVKRPDGRLSSRHHDVSHNRLLFLVYVHGANPDWIAQTHVDIIGYIHALDALPNATKYPNGYAIEQRYLHPYEGDRNVSEITLVGTRGSTPQAPDLGPYGAAHPADIG
jgi:hypothetical protein